MSERRVQSRLLMAALALLTVAFLWPTEEAVDGQGLQWAVAWLILSAACARWGPPAAIPRRPGFRLNAADLGVLMIVMGHAISTAGVFHVEGDRRSALNLTFEWMGLLAAWYCWRTLFRFPAARSGVAGVVLGMSLGLAAFGIWQHAVFYPREASEYLRMRNALESSSAAGKAAETAALLAEFRQRGYPVDGATRVLFENRLLSSSEPFATFVLANTLGGVLAAALVLLLSVVRSAHESAGHRRWHVVWLMACAALLGWCLLLTKSRSAWVGGGCGVLLLGFLRHRTRIGMQFLKGVIVLTGAVLLLGTVAGFTGAIDKEVISESPRSLQFRLLYWTGTLRMLREQPVLGPGPGNFRSSYLPHKSPESSEEIRDPHNVFLEAWSAGGLCALAGLTMLVGVTLGSMWRIPAEAGENSERDAAAIGGPGVRSGFAIGLAMHAAWSWIHGASFGTDQAPALLLASGAVLVLAGRGLRVSVDGSAGLAMFVTLLVHLLASGGLESPAVMLLLLAGSALTISPPVAGASMAAPLDANTSMWRRRALCGGAISGAIVVVWWGLVPVQRVGLLMSEATARLELDHNPGLAMAAIQQAVKFDPVAVAPRQREVEIATYPLRALQALMSTRDVRPGSGDAPVTQEVAARIQAGLEACDRLIAADRRSLAGFKHRAELRTLLWMLLRNPDDLAAAVADQETVVTFHPTAVLEWLELSRLYHLSSGDEADQRSESAARRVQSLEAINRVWGHQDQWLTADQLSLLKQLLAE